MLKSKQKQEEKRAALGIRSVKCLEIERLKDARLSRTIVPLGARLASRLRSDTLTEHRLLWFCSHQRFPGNERPVRPQLRGLCRPHHYWAKTCSGAVQSAFLPGPPSDRFVCASHPHCHSAGHSGRRRSWIRGIYKRLAHPERCNSGTASPGYI